MVRLPQPGGDAGNWGQILNDFLSQTHEADGMLKPAVIQASNLAPDAVGTTALANSSVTASSLNAATGSTGQVLTLDSAAPGGFKWSTITTGSSSPIGAAGGDLGGSYPNPTVPALATKADIATVYTKTQIDTALAAKADTTSLAGYVAISQKGAVSGVASLDVTGKVPSTQLPALVPQVNADWSAASGLAQILNKPVIPAQFNPIAGTNVTLTGTYPDVTISATPGAGVTDLSTTTAATTVTIVSSTGNDAIVAGATSGVAGVLTAADKTKLDTIAIGATVNATDAALRDRSTHTGTQAIATVTGLQTALDAKVDSSLIGVASGVAGLDATGKVPVAQLPASTGEANTASTIGTAGVGIFKQKTGVDLQFKKINVASNKLTVTDDTVNDEVKLDVAVANLGLTKSDVGLSNVDNTADSNKPVSTAVQTALNLKFDTANLDIDNTLAANSDTKVASQKATKTYVDTRLATKADSTSVGAKVLLIDTIGSLPAGTPAGVVVVVKS